MKYITIALLLVGMGFFGLILYQTDLNEVWHRLREIGVGGMGVILMIHLIAFVADALAWLLATPPIPLNGLGLYRLSKVFLIGEAFNRVMPALGGEPIKAALLKQHYGIGYREATASLILSQTIGVISLIPFLLCGFLLMLAVDSVPLPYRLAAGLGLVVISTCIGIFFLVQRHKVFSRTGRRIGRGWMGARALALLHAVHEVEDRLIAFYSGHRRRLAWALGFGFLNWLLGAVEVYYALAFLGHPVTFTEAWVIEAAVSLVRFALFFVPWNLGTQDGAFLLMCGIITGSPVLGLAVDAVVRFRELVWVMAGLLLGWLFLPRHRVPVGGLGDSLPHSVEQVE